MPGLDSKASVNKLTAVMERIYTWPHKFAIVLALLIIAIGYRNPDLAERIASIFSPLTSIVSIIYPMINSIQYGIMPKDFYANMLSMGIICSCLTGIFMFVLGIGRYYNNPGRFAEFIAERRHLSMQSIFMFVFSLLFLFYLKFITYLMSIFFNPLEGYIDLSVSLMDFSAYFFYSTAAVLSFFVSFFLPISYFYYQGERLLHKLLQK